MDYGSLVLSLWNLRHNVLSGILYYMKVGIYSLSACVLACSGIHICGYVFWSYDIRTGVLIWKYLPIVINTSGANMTLKRPLNNRWSPVCYPTRHISTTVLLSRSKLYNRDESKWKNICVYALFKDLIFVSLYSSWDKYIRIKYRMIRSDVSFISIVEIAEF